MKYFAVGLLGGLLGLLQFNATESLWLWKLSIVATEYGHWIAPPLFALGVFALTRHARAGGASLVIAALLLLGPSLQYALLAPTVADEMRSAFGTDGRAPSILSLWSTRGEVWVAPRPVTYWKGEGATLAMDYYPARAAGAAPWVVVVHGGGWDSGDAKQLPELNTALAARGYAVFAIDYRLAPRWRWPAPREDVRRAVEHIRGHAAEFGVDPERWALLGRSAGGQIAEAVGLGDKLPGLRGVIAFYAPSDMNVSYEWGRDDDILASRGLVRAYMGGEPAQLPALYRDASPTTYVSAQAPPTLLFHGPRDPLVSVRHSRDLDARLRAAGAASLAVEIPWATHGFDYNLSGPGGQISTFSIMVFLKRVFA